MWGRTFRTPTPTLLTLTRVPAGVSKPLLITRKHPQLPPVNHLHANPLPFLSDLSALSNLQHTSTDFLMEKDSLKAHTRMTVLLAMRFLLDFKPATMLELWGSIGRIWRLEGWSLQWEQQP